MASPTAPTKSVAPAVNGQAVATAEKQINPATKVAKMISDLINKGALHLPADYSSDNALKLAYLRLLQTTNKDGRPVLEACEPSSITNALLDMAIQGLNPSKDQCYFIARGKVLYMERSYHGEMAVAQRVKPGITFVYSVVREGEDVQIANVRGIDIVTAHSKSFATLNGPIIGAYCGVIDADGTELGYELMTMDRIKKSWEMSPLYKENGNSVHNKFPAEMALRTVIRKRAKQIVRTSDDKTLMESLRRQDIEGDYVEAQILIDAEQGAAGVMAAPSLPEPTHEPIPAPALESEPADDLGY